MKRSEYQEQYKAVYDKITAPESSVKRLGNPLTQKPRIQNRFKYVLAAALLLIFISSSTYAALSFKIISPENTELLRIFFPKKEDANKMKGHLSKQGYIKQIGDYKVSILSSFYDKNFGVGYLYVSVENTNPHSKEVFAVRQSGNTTFRTVSGKTDKQTLLHQKQYFCNFLGIDFPKDAINGSSLFYTKEDKKNSTDKISYLTIHFSTMMVSYCTEPIHQIPSICIEKGVNQDLTDYRIPSISEDQMNTIHMVGKLKIPSTKPLDFLTFASSDHHYEAKVGPLALSLYTYDQEKVKKQIFPKPDRIYILYEGKRKRIKQLAATDNSAIDFMYANPKPRYGFLYPLESPIDINKVEGLIINGVRLNKK